MGKGNVAAKIEAEPTKISRQRMTDGKQEISQTLVRMKLKKEPNCYLKLSAQLNRFALQRASQIDQLYMFCQS